ncbi:DUF72 domain-containing protein [Pseudomonas sp. Bout1]|uniref:DUF72 domain-containing protein n=1 Tax=Pseudomonas sp. Bout1 TaxID=3048600 RepID=UPI002AB579DF|nr:DUF72 domain-containing protein [Pseudomonas sp. Bout1]MDY7532903.1 DUF72 domain-containing protein [Pseudomonas sp. Bout1]MEB0188568.1 DUF72 domain-containing protein [Pseudomonas sp. Bout1]
MTLFLGCAGWSLPREQWPRFANQGTHLQRYAGCLNAVEINSSFYRPHRPQTYARWAQSVPPGFRFSVKVPRRVTHELRLHGCDTALDEFLSQCLHLGDRLGCLLVQLPPSLSYDAITAAGFFTALRLRFAGNVVLEPRHVSWAQGEAILQAFQIGRVAADPPVIAEGDTPKGWQGVRYWRLHGSPRVYHSAYETDRLWALNEVLRAAMKEGVPAWCIFDNTASGHAISDVLALQAMLAS